MSVVRVSVVVPVYNAQEHLEDCLESLLAQTMDGIEIIAVDDGSTDRSRDILSSAAARGKLRLLTLGKNSGVSAARNAGLDAARGTYVAFVDADDLLSPVMYESLYRIACSADADIVHCGMRLVSADGTVATSEPPPLSPHRVYNPDELREVLHQAWDMRLLWYPVRGIYRRNLLISNGIRFDRGIRKGEDSLFNLRALSLAVRVTATGEALYDYRKHSASATARPLASESGNLERLGHAVTQFYRDNGFDCRAFDDFYRHVLRSDLPTAVARLSGHPQSRAAIRDLLGTDTVQQAFRTQRISQLWVPLKVRVLLHLGRWRLASLIVLSAWLSRRGAGLRKE